MIKLNSIDCLKKRKRTRLVTTTLNVPSVLQKSKNSKTILVNLATARDGWSAVTFLRKGPLSLHILVDLKLQHDLTTINKPGATGGCQDS